jgi:hypothetical protein
MFCSVYVDNFVKKTSEDSFISTSNISDVWEEVGREHNFSYDTSNASIFVSKQKTKTIFQIHGTGFEAFYSLQINCLYGYKEKKIKEKKNKKKNDSV